MGEQISAGGVFQHQTHSRFVLLGVENLDNVFVLQPFEYLELGDAFLHLFILSCTFSIHHFNCLKKKERKIFVTNTGIRYLGGIRIRRE